MTNFFLENEDKWTVEISDIVAVTTAYKRDNPPLNGTDKTK